MLQRDAGSDLPDLGALVDPKITEISVNFFGLWLVEQTYVCIFELRQN